MLSPITPGSPALLRSVRAGFVMQGSTIARWCKDNGITRSYAYRALRGDTNGAGAADLRGKLVRASQRRAAA